MVSNAPVRLIGEPWECALAEGREGWVMVNGAVLRRSPTTIGSTVTVRDARYTVIGIRMLMGDERPEGAAIGVPEMAAELTLAPESGGS